MSTTNTPTVALWTQDTAALHILMGLTHPLCSALPRGVTGRYGQPDRDRIGYIANMRAGSTARALIDAIVTRHEAAQCPPPAYPKPSFCCAGRSGA